MGRTTGRDLIMRESALMDYTATWVMQLAQLMSAIQLNYNPLSPMYSQMGTLLVSQAHKMDSLSLLLSCAAITPGDPLLNQAVTCSRATAICYQQLAAKGITLRLKDLDSLAGAEHSWTP